MTNLTAVLAEVLAGHRVRDTAALIDGVPTWTSTCTCGGYLRNDTYTSTAECATGLTALSDDARAHVAEQLAAAVAAELRTEKTADIASTREECICGHMPVASLADRQRGRPGSYLVIDEMTWPHPHDPAGIEQRLRYGTAQDLHDVRMIAASYVAAYRQLCGAGTPTREQRIRQLREVVDHD